MFFAVYFIIFRLLPSRFLITLIIIGSLIFYGWWNPLLIWVPAVLCTIAFFGTNWMEKTPDGRAKKFRLVSVILVLFIPLVVFKYTNFVFNEMMAPIFALDDVDLKFVLPLGISFITFTMISYVSDVYSKRFPIEKKYTELVAYTLFFPQLIAGPILRPAELIPQLIRGHQKKISSIGLGVTIFTVGLIKKVIFADGIASSINPIFANPLGYSLLEYWLAIVGFAMQIYCDFSGYTDMAIGLAVILGIKLPMNFNQPYMAINLQDFWQRWHMTLSRWLRDYLYIPLGGSRCSKPRHLTNILVTMILGGLWHGANWTFIIWGALHGVAIAINHAIGFFPLTQKLSNYTPKTIKRILTLAFILFAWVFFRAEDAEGAMTIISGSLFSVVDAPSFFSDYAFELLLIGVFVLLHRYDTQAYVRLAYRKMNKLFLTVTIVFFWLIVVAASTGSSQEFIYFDF
ncbi:MBOAT family protein [Mariprofundus sp. NF]|nr:MBOAT family protein [Mariprofundus sp. NF]